MSDGSDDPFADSDDDEFLDDDYFEDVYLDGWLQRKQSGNSKKKALAKKWKKR